MCIHLSALIKELPSFDSKHVFSFQKKHIDPCTGRLFSIAQIVMEVFGQLSRHRFKHAVFKHGYEARIEAIQRTFLKLTTYPKEAYNFPQETHEILEYFLSSGYPQLLECNFEYPEKEKIGPLVTAHQEKMWEDIDVVYNFLSFCTVAETYSLERFCRIEATCNKALMLIRNNVMLSLKDLIEEWGAQNQRCAARVKRLFLHFKFNDCVEPSPFHPSFKSSTLQKHATSLLDCPQPSSLPGTIRSLPAISETKSNSLPRNFALETPRKNKVDDDEGPVNSPILLIPNRAFNEDPSEEDLLSEEIQLKDGILNNFDITLTEDSEELKPFVIQKTIEAIIGNYDLPLDRDLKELLRQTFLYECIRGKIVVFFHELDGYSKEFILEPPPKVSGITKAYKLLDNLKKNPSASSYNFLHACVSFFFCRQKILQCYPSLIDFNTLFRLIYATHINKRKRFIQELCTHAHKRKDWRIEKVPIFWSFFERVLEAQILEPDDLVVLLLRFYNMPAAEASFLSCEQTLDFLLELQKFLRTKFYSDFIFKNLYAGDILRELVEAFFKLQDMRPLLQSKEPFFKPEEIEHLQTHLIYLRTLTLQKNSVSYLADMIAQQYQVDPLYLPALLNMPWSDSYNVKLEGSLCHYGKVWQEGKIGVGSWQLIGDLWFFHWSLMQNYRTWTFQVPLRISAEILKKDNTLLERFQKISHICTSESVPQDNVPSAELVLKGFPADAYTRAMILFCLEAKIHFRMQNLVVLNPDLPDLHPESWKTRGEIFSLQGKGFSLYPPSHTRSHEFNYCVFFQEYSLDIKKLTEDIFTNQPLTRSQYFSLDVEQRKLSVDIACFPITVENAFILEMRLKDEKNKDLYFFPLKLDKKMAPEEVHLLLLWQLLKLKYHYYFMTEELLLKGK